jgi:hypothetical protein
MKSYLSLSRAVLLALALGTAGVPAAFADDASTSTSTPDSGKCSHHGAGAVLTPDEKAQLKKDVAAAFAANSNLQTDKDNLKAQFEKLKGEGKDATSADWQALHEQRKTFHQELDAALMQVDSTIGPILAKLKAAHHGCHHHQADADSSTT